METNSRVRYFALLGIIVGAVACADNSPTAPISRSPLLRRDAATAGSRRPTRFANSIKYSNKGGKHARGQAGTATLEARALLGRDGTTTLDISTGAIDGAPGAGILSKVQLKLFAPNGTQQTTTNYKDINSPVYQLTLAGRVRGSKIEVQGKVLGVDGIHTDVVSLTETVKLRPDLSVDRISSPTRSQLGTPVEITALISENNGDVGARSDCVLAVDGVEAGRAHGIWVDAGRSVSCVFSHVFPTTGTKQLTVSAVSVIPGDWNASNNAATSTIEIVLARNDFTWEGFYTSVTNFTGTSFSEGYYSQVGVGDRADYRQLQVYRRFNGWSAQVEGRVALMTGPLTFSFHDEIDGKVLTDVDLDPATDRFEVYEASYEDPAIGTVHYRGECTQAYRVVPIIFEGQEIESTPFHISLCNWHRNGPSGPLPDLTYTDFNYLTAAGDVSYYAEDYRKYDDGTPENRYGYTFTFNGDIQYVYGNVTLGNDYSFALKISGTEQTRSASGTIHTGGSYEYIVSTPYQCEDWTSDAFFGHLCSSGDYRQTVNFGRATGTPDP